MYGSVEQAYALAMPPDSLWPTGRVRRGRVDLPTPDPGNTGTGVVDAQGNPHGNYDITLECMIAGEINRTDIENPGGLPEFRISLDGTTTWSRNFRVSEDRDTAYLRDEMTGLECGIIFSFAINAAGDPPTFDVGDTFTLIAAPSPDVVLHLDAAGSVIDDALCNTLKLPLTSVPLSVIVCQAELARWSLIRKCGLDKDQDHKAYSPDRPNEHLGGLSVTDKLERWRRGQDIAQFAVADEGAVRFTKYVKPSEPMAPYLKI
jgi:hypothetical protein